MNMVAFDHNTCIKIKLFVFSKQVSGEMNEKNQKHFSHFIFFETCLLHIVDHREIL